MEKGVCLQVSDPALSFQRNQPDIESPEAELECLANYYQDLIGVQSPPLLSADLWLDVVNKMRF